MDNEREKTTSPEGTGDDLIGRKPGKGDQTPGPDMPGGTKGYAGRGDTGSGAEAPGGADAYASDHVDAEEADDRK